MKIIDCQTTKTGIYAIMTDQEKIDLLTKVAHWIESNTKSERQYHTNYGIIEEITHHGSGYSFDGSPKHKNELFEKAKKFLKERKEEKL